jgi:hypothetical protein
MAKADPQGFSESAKDSLSKFVFVSSRMKPNVAFVEKLLQIMPFILNAIQAQSLGTDVVVEVKVLVVGALSRFLKLLEGWAKTSAIPSLQVKNLVVSTLQHTYRLFPFLQSTHIQTTYLVGLAIKWLLVDDPEIRDTSFLVCRHFLSGLYFPSSDLQKLGDITKKVIQTKKLSSKQELDFVEIFLRSGIKIAEPSFSNVLPSKVIAIGDSNPVAQQASRNTEYVRDAAYIYDKSKKPVPVDSVWSDLAEKSLKRKLPSSLKTEPSFKIARPSQPAKSSSILQQIKSDVALHYTKIPDSIKPNINRPRAPDAHVRVVEKEADPSPLKPKRSTQLIEITGPKPRGVSIRVPGSNPSAKLKDLTSLYKEILSWDYDPDRSTKAPSSIPCLRKIPDSFGAHEDYVAVFEPLILMECWSQLVRAKEENPNPLKWTATCQEVSMVDSFNGKYAFKVKFGGI